MSFSLFKAIMPSYLQILGSVGALVGKAEAFCAHNELAPEEILQARLAADMFPFAYQVKSVVVHSLGAIEGVRKGVFSPDTAASPPTFGALAQRISQTLAVLRAIEPDEINSYLGQPMRFTAGERRVDYTAEEFLLSFSQPNFYFHATTAYDLLRWKGVALGKRDYLGQVRSLG